MVPLVRSARTSALAACSTIALVGVVAGTVRLLPWLLDPDVPLRVAAPFARGLAALALESALVVGWPVGWAIASFRFVETGEERVLQSLGEPPAATVRRLVPQGAVFALALGTVALISGADAKAPGRVATELLAAGRDSCAGAHSPLTYVVPFTGMTWLCAPGREPRLAGSAPGAVVRGATLTARSARISGDFRAIELEDARVSLRGDPPVAVHAGVLTMHGMAPWAHASTLDPVVHALLLALSAWLASSLAAYCALRFALSGRAGAMTLGAAGPVAALGVMRGLERADAHGATFVAVPLIACAAAAGMGLLLAYLARIAGFAGAVDAGGVATSSGGLARRLAGQLAARLAGRPPRC